MGFAQLIVILVMGGSDLEATGAEVHFNVAVFNHGDFAAYEGHDYFLALEPFVFRVLGVDTHCRIAHDCLGTSRGHYCIVSFGIAGNVIAQIVKL